MAPSPIELLSVLETKSGPAIKDEIYFFKDKGEREVALRYDFTVGLTRYAASQKSMKLPAKISSAGGVWRYDEPQKARFRYFNQWDIEIFGKLNLEHDAEVIEFTSKFFKKINLKNVEIDISHRKLAESYIHKIFETEDAKTTADILRAVDKIVKKSKQEILSEYKEKGYSSEKLEKIIQFSETIGTPESIEAEWDTNTLDGWNEIKVVFESLRYRNVKNIRINFGIVRGLDYYSGIVFEVFDMHPENNRAIAGGGSYANLLQIFNESPLAGVGFGLGDVTLKDFLESHKLLPDFNKAESDVLIVYTEDTLSIDAIQLAEKLREKLNVECHLGRVKFNKIIKLAENKGHSFVLIIEKRDEVLSIQLKDLVKKTSMQVEHGGISEILKLIKDKA